MRRPEKPTPPQHERAKKRQTPVGERHIIKPTVLIQVPAPAGGPDASPSGGPQHVAQRAESCYSSRASGLYLTIQINERINRKTSMLLTSLKVLAQHGTQYIRHLDRVKLCDEFRGRPVLRSAGLTPASADELCRLCPTGAISFGQGLALDMGRCLFCGECAVRFPAQIRFTNDYRLASPTREGLVDL